MEEQLLLCYDNSLPGSPPVETANMERETFLSLFVAEGHRNRRLFNDWYLGTPFVRTIQCLDFLYSRNVNASSGPAMM
jgi:hypothetical protein